MFHIGEWRISRWGSRMTSDKQCHRSERLQVILPPAEIAAIEDFRYRARIPSRAAAVRELLRRGLASVRELDFPRSPHQH